MANQHKKADVTYTENYQQTKHTVMDFQIKFGTSCPESICRKVINALRQPTMLSTYSLFFFSSFKPTINYKTGRQTY